MLELETCLQQKVKIALSRVSINDLAAGLPELSRQLGRAAAATLLDQLQAQHFESVWDGAAEIVCTRCGVVHSGRSGNLLRRGSRPRRLMTSSGLLDFRLHQVTCGDCRRTWSPFAEWLGLAERQRVCEELERKLVECVTELSYLKTCTLGEAWLGASVSPKRLHAAVQKRGAEVKFTPAPECAVVVQADGTKVPAGKNPRGCDAWFSLQILGRTKVNGRIQVQKRIAGWGIGSRAWESALPSGIASELILTDREKGVSEFLQREHPDVRHGLCEWHLGRTLNQRLHFDGVKVEDRKPLVGQLSDILSGPLEERAEAYTEFTRSLAPHRRAHGMLSSSAPHVLYDAPQPERTTSVIEREMREINRRADVGVRWTIKGIDHLLRLRHSKRINPDDFERVWSEVQTPSFTVVPLP